MLLDDEAELRASLREHFGDEAGDEYDRVSLVPPDHLVVERQELDLGDHGVQLAHLGRGHTGNDLVVVVPDSGVVFAGDLIEESAPPAYGDDCYPMDWPATAADADRPRPGGVGDFRTRPRRRDDDAETPRAGRAPIGVVAELIRELHAAGVEAGDALSEERDRWPFPARRSSTPSHEGTPRSADRRTDLRGSVRMDCRRPSRGDGPRSRARVRRGHEHRTAY